MTCFLECMHFADVVFALDDSGSIGLLSYIQAQVFMRHIVSGMNVDLGSRIGVVLFSTDAQVTSLNISGQSYHCYHNCYHSAITGYFTKYVWSTLSLPSQLLSQCYVNAITGYFTQYSWSMISLLSQLVIYCYLNAITGYFTQHFWGMLSFRNWSFKLPQSN